MLHLPKRVTIMEVGLRDGLQAEQRSIPTETKIELANSLAAAGLPGLEITSFVHPRAVPQLADAEAVFSGIARQPGTRYGALVLNKRGAERALRAAVTEVRFATMVSDTFSLRNAQMSTGDSLSQMKASADLCRRSAIPARFVAVLGTCFGCPYEGEVSPGQVARAVEVCIESGAAEVTLCDTTGMANPRQIQSLCTDLFERWPDLRLSLHLHNTRGTGLANVLAGMDVGVTAFESSVGGLGGCPYAPRATGNICTEDLVNMLHVMGVETGVELDRVIHVALTLERLLGKELPGQVMKAGPCQV